MSKNFKAFLIETGLVGILILMINVLSFKISATTESYIIISLVATLMFMIGRVIGYCTNFTARSKILILILVLTVVAEIVLSTLIGDDANENIYNIRRIARIMYIISDFLIGVITAITY